MSSSNIETGHVLLGLKISVIVPVYSGGEAFRQCLQSLVHMAPPPAEVIVVVDGGTDDSWRVAEEFGVQVFRLPTRGGPACARNYGAGAAQGDVLFFVDADVTIPPEAVCQIVSAFMYEPDLTALFGSYDDEPAVHNFLSQYKNLFHHYVHQMARENASSFWGACGAVRRDAFLAVGGFDEGYRQPSIEDIELGYRLKRAGFRIRLCKTLQVKHLKRWSARSLLKADFLYRALPWTTLILQDRHFPNDLNLQLSSRVSVFLLYMLLAAAVSSWRWLGFGTVASGVLIVLLLVLNAPLYQFFRHKRGLVFALQTIPWHWLYYGYSGLAFAIGVINHLVQDRRRSLVKKSGEDTRRAHF